MSNTHRPRWGAGVRTGELGSGAAHTASPGWGRWDGVAQPRSCF